MAPPDVRKSAGRRPVQASFREPEPSTPLAAAEPEPPKYLTIPSMSGNADRDDDEHTAEGAAPSVTTTKYQEHWQSNAFEEMDDQDPDVDRSGSGDGDGSGDERSFSRGSSTNTMSSHSSTNSTGTSSTFVICGRKLKVPFTVWTLVAMLVPIILVSVFTGMQVGSSHLEMRTSKANTELAVAVTECVGALMAERGMSAEYLALRTETSRAVVAATRLAVEQICKRDFGAVMKSRGKWDDWMNGEEERYMDRLILLGGFRRGVDLLEPSQEESMDFYTALIKATTASLNHAAGQVRLNSHVFFNIISMTDMRSYLGLVREFAYIVALTPQKTEAIWVEQEQDLRNGLTAANAGVSMTQLVTEQSLQRKLQDWQRTGAGVQYFSRVGMVVAAMDRRDEAAIVGMADAIWDEMTAALTSLQGIESDHVSSIGAQDAEEELIDAIIFLVVGIVSCLVAGALLAWKQLQVKSQLEKQVENIARTRKAVQAFVPRFFLRKMGYTSILQVKCGESTDVAVAMLFSDIRHFTTVSEGMTSSKLFDWIQGYFKRVTTIVEQRHGNVNQFIGDALFAIFSHANDAAWCAAEMESSVQQLNVERQCADPSSFPIEIGVGLHFDVVAMGILGDENRHTCTTISASVNLASRLEGLTKQFGARIIASQEVIDQLTVGEAPGSGIMRRRIGATMVKGSIKKVTIYDLFQTDDRALYLYKEETKEAFQRAADGILAGTIRPPKAPEPVEDAANDRAAASFSSIAQLASFGDLCPHRVSLPGEVLDGPAESNATIPQVLMNASGSQSSRQVRR
jgi:class 3 adenylate cyclase